MFTVKLSQLCCMFENFLNSIGKENLGIFKVITTRNELRTQRLTRVTHGCAVPWPTREAVESAG